MTRAKRNAGGVALARVGKTGAEIGALLGRSKVTVSRWIAGERIPSPQDREAMRAAFGIQPDLWDRAPERRGTKPVAAPAPPPPKAEVLDDAGVVGGALTSLRALQAELDLEIQLLREEREEGKATPIERRRGLRELGKLALELAEGTGQLDLGRIMMRLPIWKRAMAELREALGPFPDASRAVAARFDALDRAWSDGR